MHVKTSTCAFREASLTRGESWGPDVLQGAGSHTPWSVLPWTPQGGAIGHNAQDEPPGKDEEWKRPLSKAALRRAPFVERLETVYRVEHRLRVARAQAGQWGALGARDPGCES